MKLDAESDDFGIYNSEYVIIENSSFDAVQGALVNYYRGGTDESTFGPHFVLSGSVLNQVGNGSRNKSGASVLLHGLQVTDVSNNRISNSPAIKVFHTVGEPITRIVANTFESTPAPEVVELNSNQVDTATIQDNEYK